MARTKRRCLKRAKGRSKRCLKWAGGAAKRKKRSSPKRGKGCWWAMYHEKPYVHGGAYKSCGKPPEEGDVVSGPHPTREGALRAGDRKGWGHGWKGE